MRTACYRLRALAWAALCTLGVLFGADITATGPGPVDDWP
ncbi:hypothetical protein BX266_0747 [Streptomyces sp. TLI_171]|nr:hypothetical protein BX266_0747 [Streptomyces sp. TLI_171]